MIMCMYQQMIKQTAFIVIGALRVKLKNVIFCSNTGSFYFIKFCKFLTFTHMYISFQLEYSVGRRGLRKDDQKQRKPVWYCYSGQLSSCLDLVSIHTLSGRLAHINPFKPNGNSTLISWTSLFPFLGFLEIFHLY